jgi:hypothetical protein
LSHLPDIAEETFRRYLMDLSLHVAVILVLMFSLYLIRKAETPTAPCPSS